MSDNIELMGGGIYKGAFNNSLSEEAKKRMGNDPRIDRSEDRRVVKRTEYSSKKKKSRVPKNFKKGFYTGVIATVMTVSVVTMGANAIGNKIQQNSYPYEYTMEGNQSIRAASYILKLQPGDTEYHHAYHFDVIVDAVAKGDFDAELFGAYNGMMRDTDRGTALSNMDTLVHLCNLRGMTDCTNFVNYCEERGYVDQNGKIDTKAYESALKEYCRNLETIDKANENVSQVRK